MAHKTFSGGDKLDAKLREIAAKLKRGGAVEIGFPEGAAYPDGKPVAYIAAIQEFGAPSRGIPSRPYFRTMIALKSPKWGDALGNLVISTNYDAASALGLMGQGIQGQLQTSIRDWSDPPNAPSTIAAKGFNAPLIDTGAMLRTVTYTVLK